MTRRELLTGLAGLFLAGCAAGPQDGTPRLVLRYADNQPAGYPTTQAAEYFAQLVEERTQGKVAVRVYCDGVLGDESSVFEQVQFGGVDLMRISVGTLSEYHADVELLQLPYLYDDSEHMWRVLDGEIGAGFLARIRAAGAIGLSWLDAGARSFYTRQPVHCLEDLQGLTIRVQESQFMSRMVQLLGAQPVQIPYGEVYSALQTAAIDGAENNWPSYESTGHFTAAPYMLRDEHSRLPELQVMSCVALDKLEQVDPDYPAIVRQCARESALYERELWQQREQESEQLVIEHGCVVTELSDAERERFRQAVQPIYEGYSEQERQRIEEIKNS